MEYYGMEDFNGTPKKEWKSCSPHMDFNGNPAVWKCMEVYGSVWKCMEMWEK